MNEQDSNFNEEVAKMTSERLCEVIVSYRYLGLLKDQSIICMKELMRRKEAGDTFAFENVIETMQNSLPKLSLDIKSILSVPGTLSGLGVMFGKGKK